jgi:dynactin complex subunit
MSVGTEVVIDGSKKGIIRWRGSIENEEMFGVELDEKEAGTCDGTFEGVRYFTSPDGSAMFVPSSRVRPAKEATEAAVKLQSLFRGLSARKRSAKLALQTSWAILDTKEG